MVNFVWCLSYHTPKKGSSVLFAFYFQIIISQEKHPHLKKKKKRSFEQGRLSQWALRQVWALKGVQVTWYRAHVTIPALHGCACDGGGIPQPLRASLVTELKSKNGPEGYCADTGSYVPQVLGAGPARGNAQQVFAGLHALLRLQASPNNLSSV